MLYTKASLGNTPKAIADETPSLVSPGSPRTWKMPYIAALPPAQQPATRAAFQYLSRLATSPYIAAGSPPTPPLERGTTPEHLRLALGALLEPLLETALWPHLYPTRALCESNGRRAWKAGDVVYNEDGASNAGILGLLKPEQAFDAKLFGTENIRGDRHELASACWPGPSTA